MNYNIVQPGEFSRYERLCMDASQLGDKACAALIDCPSHVRHALASRLAPDMAHDALLAYIDEDTQLPNKRAMHREFERLLNEGDPFAVIMVDIDKFKDVNEQVGHSRADELLAGYGANIQKRVREDDTLFFNSGAYRVGGDEFIILASLKGRGDLVLTNTERLERLASRLNEGYLDGNTIMSVGNEMLAITATAHGEVVDPREHTDDNMSTILNNISLAMLAKKRCL